MAEASTVKERLQNDPLAVDASPTKAFFVSIITRDIQLDKAIADLIDNCVDGAKRLRPGPDERFDGLEIELEISPERFSIKDNCGGIELNTARHYAFKFGRDADAEETPFSVGQFGVGMKRALFKMGKSFVVETTDPHHKFSIAVNVPNWLKDNDIWDFRVSNLIQGNFPADQLGTQITVENLHDGVKQIFTQSYFLTQVRNQIKTTQHQFLRRGLAVAINGVSLISDEWNLRTGEGIFPFFARYSDDLGGTDAIKTRLYAGVGDSQQSKAGWYIFCNGRCIVEADQSRRTGWGEIEGENGVRIPKYHNQFARFRGYAFLDCADASQLPWNTTKTDIDLENPAYRLLYGRMVDASRPVIDFLNDLDHETDLEETDRSLSKSLRAAAAVPLERVSERVAFTYDPPVRKPSLTRVSYQKPPEQVEALKSALKVRTAKELGIATFDSAYERLVAEDDL